MDKVVWWCALLSPCSYFRERRLKRERHPYDYERDYLAAFPTGAYRDEVARFVWERLQHYVCIREFPVKPDDSLRNLYGLDDEEIFDVILCDLVEELLDVDRDYFDLSGYYISLIDDPVSVYNFFKDIMTSLGGLSPEKERSIHVENIFTRVPDS